MKWFFPLISHFIIANIFLHPKDRYENHTKLLV
nr:MAG TPA: hypothetical protein [Caudoviricetes sp.]